MTLQLTRTRMRVTGGLIGYDAIACGSSSTSAAATAIGTVTITHGMEGVPKAVLAAPYASTTLAAAGRRVALKGIDAAYITYIVASAAPLASVVDTAVGSVISSSVVMTFVWLAIPA